MILRKARDLMVGDCVRVRLPLPDHARWMRVMMMQRLEPSVLAGWEVRLKSGGGELILRLLPSDMVEICPGGAARVGPESGGRCPGCG